MENTVPTLLFVAALIAYGLPLALASVHEAFWKGYDTIVLADFVNTTGDAVFHDTLKQAQSMLRASCALCVGVRVSRLFTFTGPCFMQRLAFSVPHLGEPLLGRSV